MGNPWFPFYMGDYLRDTQHLNTLEHGAYLKLIIHYYTTQQPIPDDDELLMQICGVSKFIWKKSGSKVKNLFDKSENYLLHKRIEAELEKSKNLSENRRLAALKGGWASCPPIVTGETIDKVRPTESPGWGRRNVAQAERSEPWVTFTPIHKPSKRAAEPIL